MTSYFHTISSVTNKIILSKLYQTLTKNSLTITLTLIITTIFCSFPSYDVAIFTNEMDSHWESIFRQVENPFTNHNHLYGIGSHAEKLSFRFVPAVLMNVFGIKTLIPALIFQFFTLIFFNNILVQAFFKLFQEKTKVFLYALPICFVVSGHVYCSDYRGIFDTLSLSFLLTSLLFRNKPYVIIFLLLAYFTDERAIIASPAIILINLFKNQNYDSFKSILSNIFSGINKYIWVSWILYLVIRYWLSYQFGLETGTGGIGFFRFFDQINRTIYTLYIGLEGFLILLIIVTASFIKKQNYFFSFLIISSYSIVCIVAQSVFDINRSMSYSILFIVFILVAFDRLIPMHKVYPIIILVVVISAVYDDYYPLLAQLYRMVYITKII